MNAAQMLAIGQLAAATGCKVQTIRYYEEVGLLPPPARSEGGQRRYTAAHRDRLAFIRHGRALGFSLDAIRELLDLADQPERSCAAADRIARHHLGEVEQRLAHLSALKAELERMLTACAGGKVAQCRVIEVLADHGQCLHDDHAAS